MEVTEQLRILVKSILLVYFCLFFNQYNISSAASNKITIIFDDNILNLKQPPVTVQGTNLVSLRDIAEAFGAEVDWDDHEQKISIVKNELAIQLQIGSKVAHVNGEKIMLSIAPRLNEGTAMVPLRFLSNQFDLNIAWSDETNTITLSTKKKDPVYYRDKVIFLTYHGVDPDEHGIIISPELLKQELDALQEYKYNIISMSDYLAFVDHGKPIPPNAVVLTFDDGYDSFYTYVYPELKKRHVTATDFVIVKSSETPILKGHMTWDQMRLMKKDGMSFYNHTYNSHYYAEIDSTGNKDAVLANHLYLKQFNRIETDQEYEDRIKKDLKLAEKRLQDELGDQDSLLCFPYGYYNDTVTKVANEIGIKRFFTLNEGINDAKQTEIKRIQVGAAYITAEKMIEMMQTYNEN